MIKKFTSAVALFLFLTNCLTAQNPQRALWTYNFADPLRLSPNRTSNSPETSRSAGIAIWDESRVLLYSLLSTGGLANRQPHEGSEDAWSFLVQIVNVDTGKVERSLTLPAGSFSSELRLTYGGIVISDPGRLVFYSRAFEKLSSDFEFSPLVESRARRVPFLVRSVAGRIYATPNGQHLLLIDSDGHHSRVYIFDGTTFKNTLAGSLAEIDPRSVSIGDHGFFYTDMNSHDHVYFSNLDGVAGEWNGPGYSFEKSDAHEPTYITPDAWLDVLHTIQLVGPRGSNTLYREHKTEGVLGPAVISRDKRIAAVFKDDVETGGMFDRDLHRTGVAVLVVSLDVPGKVCEIPITPTPQTQFAMNLVGDSRLLVLQDATVSAYRVPCTD